MSDRIDELGSLARSLAHRLHLRLTEAAGAGYMMLDAQVTALTDAITELATIARETEAEADKWREAAFCVAYAWWEQDEESATDYLWYRGWDTILNGPLSFEALVEDVRQQPHPEAVKRDQR